MSDAENNDTDHYRNVGIVPKLVLIYVDQHAQGHNLSSRSS